ncbi:MAG TPA: preprotein translocase subunit Sec61beta [Thermoplasmata archaeon]|nr:preprotein translocase subunit Sec61beta [Thermoplasmata archaeon]HUJ77611.1 preprotein translocase subunit Sec61beta [Thermoplasmata archaeon]
MPDSKKSGFHSAAGLIQYYDMEESRALKIPPEVVLAIGIGAALVVLVLNWKFV